MTIVDGITAFEGTPPEFREWPKMPRLNRRVVVTEKIDGTNAAIIVSDDMESVWAQSRKKIIQPGKQTDNFGFAGWVAARADLLAQTLGPGYHYGEWYGLGIQRGYGLDEKRFMLFNTERWGKSETRELLRGTLGVEVGTVLYDGPFNTEAINAIAFNELRLQGSVHVPGFMDPEGIVIYHVAGNLSFKVTCLKDESPKGLAG